MEPENIEYAFTQPENKIYKLFVRHGRFIFSRGKLRNYYRLESFLRLIYAACLVHKLSKICRVLDVQHSMPNTKTNHCSNNQKRSFPFTVYCMPFV